MKKFRPDKALLFSLAYFSDLFFWLISLAYPLRRKGVWSMPSLTTYDKAPTPLR